ncbi:deaminase, partial [Burkholderia multivorans]
MARRPRVLRDVARARCCRSTRRSLPEPMVRCAECGVHAPQGDAIAAARGEYLC